MPFVIRAPKITDADDLGRVHVRAWLRAYRGGLMPDEYLDELSEEERASMWRHALTEEPRPRAARLAASPTMAPSSDSPWSDQLEVSRNVEVGELYAINVDPDHWGTGVGAGLLVAAVEVLRAVGFSVAILWVHPGNARARAFYEARGWVSDEVERDQEVLGVTVPEVRYSISL